MEVLAEHYHNIWAKKKKSDLGSRGDFLMKSVIDKTQRKRQYACVGGRYHLPLEVLIYACELMHISP